MPRDICEWITQASVPDIRDITSCTRLSPDSYLTSHGECKSPLFQDSVHVAYRHVKDSWLMILENNKNSH